ncbi:BREX-1 system phosphatase PglZ type A [Sphingobacteriales bacterium UPWRP_1]|nr:TIGR02687 family protein [Sphingobacteriales bacterium TSM_CSM]PSJ71620.1 BREX-1 system phosphatase PglZ type A [Sphingobacteriales bacterium UPWRP_1]
MLILQPQYSLHIMQDLIQAQFNQNPQLRVLFFFDPHQTHLPELTPWQLPHITFIEVADKHWFSLKNQLSQAEKSQKILLYLPFAKPTGKDWENFPLLGLYHANKEMLLDDTARFIEQYGLTKPEHRQLIGQYWQYLSLKKYQERLSNILEPASFTKETVQRGLICMALDLTRPEERTIVIARLLAIADNPDKIGKALDRIEAMQLTPKLLSWIDLYFAEKPQLPLQPQTFIRLAAKLKYNLFLPPDISLNHEDTYQQMRITAPQQLLLLAALDNDWQLHPHLNKERNRVMEQTAKSINEVQLMQWYGITANYRFKTDNMRLQALSVAAGQVLSLPQKVQEWLPRWAEGTQNTSLQNAFRVVQNAADMFSLLQQYNTYCFNAPQSYIDQYCQHLFQIDFWYRKAMLALGKLPESYKTPSFTQLTEQLQQRYNNYLINLNVEWLKMLQEINFNYHQINTPKQYRFYHEFIANTEQKTAVIISDALRYEIAWELMQRLQKDSKSVTNLQSALASVPSYTRLGMANLLPNKGLKVILNTTTADLDFTINDISAYDTAHRRQILKQYNPQAEALTYQDIERLNEESGRQLFKNHPLIYIYHNKIDTTGENRLLENDLPENVETAFADLEKLIRRLYSWNVYNVLITADHGFLFNAHPLPETQRENIPKTDTLLKTDQRYLIGQQGYTYPDGYSFPLAQTTNIQTNLQVHLPRAVNRFRASAQGTQYTHGGASLQEVIIPILHYEHKRQETARQVTIQLVNKDSLRITSGTVKAVLLQEQTLSNQYKKNEVYIALYAQNGTLLSTEEKKIVFDFTSLNPAERTVTVLLTLNTVGGRSNFCYLRMFDAVNDKDRLNPLLNERLVNNFLMEIDEF